MKMMRVYELFTYKKGSNIILHTQPGRGQVVSEDLRIGVGK